MARWVVGVLLGASLLASPASAVVTLTASRADVLYTTDTQFDCGELAGRADLDLPYHVVRLRAEDDGGATTFAWKLPKPNVGFLMPDDPTIDSSAAGAFALRGFCAEFGSGCVLTDRSIKSYQRPTILWAAPTCESITDVTRRQFNGDIVRFRVQARGVRGRTGKATADVSYGVSGVPVLHAGNSDSPADDGIGKVELVTSLNPVFSVVLDPDVVASTPSPIKEWFIDNGQGSSVRVDSCPFTGPAVAPGAQACAQIDYTSGGRFVARTEVRLEDGSAYCDKLRTRVGQCRGSARVQLIRSPRKRTYQSGEVGELTVRFVNTSPRNGCVYGFGRMRCDATFKLGKLEESGSATFVLPACKEDTSRFCESDGDCIIAGGIDRGPCLTTSHCSVTTTQSCSTDIDCRPTGACPACRDGESCIRVIALSEELLEQGIAPGESVDLHHEMVEIQSVLPGKAKVSETWTVETRNLESFSGSHTYRIRGVPPQ